MVDPVVFGSSREAGSVLSHPFLVRGPARSLPCRSPGLRAPRFLVIRNRSGVTPSESALSFPRSDYQLWRVGGSFGKVLPRGE